MAKKTLLFNCLLAAVFVFNSLFLYLNFSSRPDDRRPEIPPPRSLFSSLKPWPSLPSYRPWSSDLVILFAVAVSPFGGSGGIFGNADDCVEPSYEEEGIDGLTRRENHDVRNVGIRKAAKIEQISSHMPFA
ncbi:hypothetical protein M569_13775 [Genlisea aurea]|uniref:Uncharacterized protein n=1 Tax=Genlisea aurea TaxID=192259 RepID=S8C2I4_9LAMI|nr:hypothetical protein M569_13775 [Genlisea aurea]